MLGLLFGKRDQFTRCLRLWCKETRVHAVNYRLSR
jgi:hypothetical protein